MHDANLSNVTFSFVVPVFNEQDGLEEFYRRLTTAAAALGETYEIIFVNDGSIDETAAVLRRLAAADECIRVVEFSRNFGHQVALTAGYDYAAGRAVISLDGDCQHPPELIAQLIARWREGFEVVYTVRKDTEGISATKRLMVRAGYRLIAAITGIDLTDQADFRLLDRKALDALKAHREQQRFLRGLVRWIGFRQTALPYVAAKRASGRSTYSLKQTLRMAGAGIFNYSLKPLRLATAAGGLLVAVAAAYLVVSLLLWPFGLACGAMTHLWMFVTGMFGVNFLLLGLVGEYVGRTFEQSKARTLYIVRETIGLPEPGDELEHLRVNGSDRDEPQRYSVFT